MGAVLPEHPVFEGEEFDVAVYARSDQVPGATQDRYQIEYWLLQLDWSPAAARSVTSADLRAAARHPATGEMVTREPKYVCNLDNFIKTRPIQEGEPGFIESAPDA